MSYQIVRLHGGMPHRSFHVTTKCNPLAMLHKKFLMGGTIFAPGGVSYIEGVGVALEKTRLLCD